MEEDKEKEKKNKDEEDKEKKEGKTTNQMEKKKEEEDKGAEEEKKKKVEEDTAPEEEKNKKGQDPKEEEAEKKARLLQNKWSRLTGLDIWGPLISNNDDRYDLHLRLQEYCPGTTCQEYDALILLLTEALEAARLDSDLDGDDEQPQGSGDEGDPPGGDIDGIGSSIYTDTSPTRPRVDRTLESSNASKIDQISHDIKLLSKTVSLLANSSGVREVVAKMEGIKKERAVPELIEVDSGSEDNEEASTTRGKAAAKGSKADDVSESETSTREEPWNAPRRKKAKSSLGNSVRTQAQKT
jgi:hypothetical protein